MDLNHVLNAVAIFAVLVALVRRNRKRARAAS